MSQLTENTTTIQSLLDAISNLPEASGKIELPELSNPAVSSELFAEKELIDGDGNVVTGTFTIAEELADQDSLIEQIRLALSNKTADNKPEYEETVEIIQNGTTEIVAVEGQTISKVTITVTVPSSSIPEEDPSELYQRVEYITSDNSSWIMTDVIADNNCGMEMTASFSSLTDFPCMGSRLDNNDTRFWTTYPMSATASYAGFNTGIKISTSGVKADTTYILQTNFLNSRLANIYEANGTRKGSTSLTESLTSHNEPITICAYNKIYEGGPTGSRNLSLYGARCSEGHEIVREYIPCYRKSDGEIGLYEKYTKQFLTNSGTGAFTKGPDVDWNVA